MARKKKDLIDSILDQFGKMADAGDISYFLAPKTAQARKALMDRSALRSMIQPTKAQPLNSSFSGCFPDRILVEGHELPLETYRIDMNRDIIDVSNFGSGGWREYKAGQRETAIDITMNEAKADAFRHKISAAADREIFQGDLLEFDGNGHVRVATTLRDPIGVCVDISPSGMYAQIKLTGFYDVLQPEPIPDVQLLFGTHFITQAEEDMIYRRIKRDYAHVFDTGVWDDKQTGRKAGMAKSLTAATIQTIYSSQPAEMNIELQDGNEVPLDIYPVKVEWGGAKADRATVTYSIKDTKPLIELLRKTRAEWFIPTTFSIPNGKLVLGKPIPSQRIAVTAFIEGAKDEMTVLKVDIWEGELCFTSSETTKI